MPLKFLFIINDLEDFIYKTLTNGGTDTIADNNAHDNAKKTSKTEKKSLLDKVESSNHDNNIAKNNQVTNQQHSSILETERVNRIFLIGKVD